MKAKRLLLQVLMVLGGALCLAPFAWQFVIADRVRIANENMQRAMRASNDPTPLFQYMPHLMALSLGGWAIGLVGAGLFLLCFFALRRMPRPAEIPPPLPPGLG